MSRNQITRRQFLQKMALTTLTATSVGTPLLLYGSKVEPKHIAIERVTLKLPRLDPAFHGYKIVLISDFHMDYTWMSENRLIKSHANCQ